MTIPRGLYSAAHDGLLDPERLTPAERARASETRLLEERSRRSSPDAATRKLQAATDKALRKATR